LVNVKQKNSIGNRIFRKDVIDKFEELPNHGIRETPTQKKIVSQIKEVIWSLSLPLKILTQNTKDFSKIQFIQILF
jgi:hypothetical protein